MTDQADSEMQRMLELERTVAKVREAHVARLEDFAARLFDLVDWPGGGDLDGFEFQDAAAGAGVLLPEERTTPCGENCNCAEYAGDGEVVTCFRKPPWLIDALARRAKA